MSKDLQWQPFLPIFKLFDSNFEYHSNTEPFNIRSPLFLCIFSLVLEQCPANQTNVSSFGMAKSSDYGDQLKSKPFDNWTLLAQLKTRLVPYSDPHCMYNGDLNTNRLNTKLLEVQVSNGLVSK